MFQLEKAFNLLGCLSLILLGACSPTIDLEMHSEVVKEVFAVQKAYNDSYKTIYTQINKETALVDNNISQFPESNCVTTALTPDPSQFFPVDLLIAFENDCKLKDHLFSGKVIASINSPLDNAENKIDLNFDQFHINQSALLADYSLTNKGLNDEGFKVIEHKILNAQYNNISQGSSSYSASILSTHIAGFQTDVMKDGIVALQDDIWEHNLTGTFVSAKGDIYNVQSETNLVDHWECGIPTAGRMLITGAGLQSDIIIDFGDGNCDRIITMELEGQVSQLTIE